MWRSIDDAWQFPAKSSIAHGSVVSVRVSFNLAGDILPPRVIEGANPVLLPSVETALRNAKLPEPTWPVRSCLAGQSVKIDFRAERQ